MRDLDVLQLLEDEILLALPISVRHADGECVDDLRTLADPAAGKPFATLAALRGRSGLNKE